MSESTPGPNKIEAAEDGQTWTDSPSASIVDSPQTHSIGLVVGNSQPSTQDHSSHFPLDPKKPENLADRNQIRQYVINTFRVARAYNAGVNDHITSKRTPKSLERTLLERVEATPKSFKVETKWDAVRTRAQFVIGLLCLVVAGMYVFGLIGLTKMDMVSMYNWSAVIVFLLIYFGPYWDQFSYLPQFDESNKTSNVAQVVQENVQLRLNSIVQEAQKHLLSAQLRYFLYRTDTLTTSFTDLSATLHAVLDAKLTLEADKRDLYAELQQRTSQLTSALTTISDLRHELEQMRAEHSETAKLLSPEVRDQVAITVTLAEVNKMKEDAEESLESLEKQRAELGHAMELSEETRIVYEELKDKQAKLSKLECARWARARTLAEKDVRNKLDSLRKKEQADAAASGKRNGDDEDSILKGEKFKYRKGFQTAPGAPRMTAAERWAAKKKEERRDRWTLVVKIRDSTRDRQAEEEMVRALLAVYKIDGKSLAERGD